MDLNKKSMSTGVMLAIFLGPLGLLYSSVISGVIMIVFIIISLSIPFASLICWGVSILLSIQGIATHNNNVDLILKSINNGNNDDKKSEPKERKKMFLFIHEGSNKAIILVKETNDFYEFNIIEGKLDDEIQPVSSDTDIDDFIGSLKSKFKKVRSFQTIDLAEEYYDKEMKIE